MCLLLCKEEGSSPVSTITVRRDMGLYEVPLFMLVFGMESMLANFHMCGIKSRFKHAHENCDSKRVYACLVPVI